MTLPMLHDKYQQLKARHYSTTDVAQNWWTTSGDSTFLPTTLPCSEIPDAPTCSPDTLTTTSYTSSAIPTTIFTPPTTPTPTAGIPTTFTTSVPVTTITTSDATFTSWSMTEFTSLPASSTLSESTSAFPSETPTSNVGVKDLCAGDRLDASAEGLIASAILPTILGLIIWLVFAILRPKFRQIYGLREWFVKEDLRPKPLGAGFFAFLFPPVPLVPDMPEDVSSAGRSDRSNMDLFPSDEQLSQRAMWVAFLIVLGWTILGLAGALPLYLVTLPCVAEQQSTSTWGGGYSILQEMGLTRLLKLIDSGNISTQNLLSKRADGDAQNVRERIIVLTILALVLGLLPALIKILREFNKLVAYRKRWLEVMCDNKDLGWLSVTDAPGLIGWGEGRLKEYIERVGLARSLSTPNSRDESGTHRHGSSSRRRRSEDQPLNESGEMFEVDVQAVFSINDTRHLAMLIEEREVVLEELEIAETNYIHSFRLSTPDPSILSFEPPVPPQEPGRPIISRPRPLHDRRTKPRQPNPAFGTSSLATNSFVLPSPYYKLRAAHSFTNGRFADPHPSFSDSVNSRVVGSRFQEIVGKQPHRYGPVLRQEAPEDNTIPDDASWIPPTLPGSRDRVGQYNSHAMSSDFLDDNSRLHTLSEEGSEDWVDVAGREPIHEMLTEPNGRGQPPRTQARKQRHGNAREASTSTFPLRKEEEYAPPAPHLRVQPSQPFVRPKDGVDFDLLGSAYTDIQGWRQRLKAINAEIMLVQHDCYTDIADGARIKGWLMVGRGLRHIHGVQVIEGRAKEDIRWDVLQNERTIFDTIVLWSIFFVASVLLAAGLTAAVGLSLGLAPDVAHYLPFLQPLLEGNSIAAGIATVLAPAVASCVFIFLALYILHWSSDLRGTVSVSGGKLLVYRVTFYVLAVVAAVSIVVIGALVFSLKAFNNGAKEAASIADGAIYMAVLAMAILIQVAIIIPGLLMLQPLRLWRVLRAEKNAVTPRQRFRALYPRSYDPSFATGACVLGIVFASTFTLIFPLIGPPIVVLLLLTLIAHRYLVGYVYGRTHSQTGGLLQIWLMKRFGSLLAIQPILLGLIFLTRNIWIEGGVLVGVGAFVIVFVETYTRRKLRQPGVKSISSITRDALDVFKQTAQQKNRRIEDDESFSFVTAGDEERRSTPPRGSIASVLDMMSLTLNVTPSTSRGAVPLRTETLDDLIDTERAARTHPEAPPRLAVLSIHNTVDEMSGILYAPELVQQPPTIWLPNDHAGVARAEAADLEKYHEMHAILTQVAESESRHHHQYHH